ncbi:MAG: polysaccharide deacetylase family protein [Peptococcales bacterium]
MVVSGNNKRMVIIISKVLFLSRRRIAKIFLVAIIILCSAGVFKEPIFNQANQALGVLVPGSQLKPIYYVDTKDKKIAISFDATWGAEYTPKILGILEQYNLKTTFFLTNIWLKEYPDIAKKIRMAGHEIGMHSVSHPHFNRLSEEQIAYELKGNHDLIEEVTGFQAKLFRPPFGEYSNKVIQVTESMGYIPIQWSIDSLDWKENITKEDIINRIIKNLHPGAIVLFHNNGRYTADALEEIIVYTMEQGYEIIPISHLIYKENYFVDHQGAQKLKPTN